MTIAKKRICVFCGSTIGFSTEYANAAVHLGQLIGESSIDLVYGGGGSGLMGLVAKSALQNDGHVIGIMPSELVNVENALYEVSEYHEVDSFHERKRLMSTLSDAFIALPGGPGTMEELIEQIALVESEQHGKPIIIININGYWNALIKLLKVMEEKTLSIRKTKPKYFVVDKPEQAIEVALAYWQERTRN